LEGAFEIFYNQPPARPITDPRYLEELYVRYKGRREYHSWVFHLRFFLLADTYYHLLSYLYELVWAIIFVSWVVCGFAAWFFTDVCHDVCWRSHVIKRLPGNALTNYHSAECNLKYEVHVLMGSIWCVRYILRYDIGRWSFSILWWFAGSNSFMNYLLGRCLCRFDSHTYLVNLSGQSITSSFESLAILHIICSNLKGHTRLWMWSYRTLRVHVLVDSRWTSLFFTLEVHAIT